MNTAPNAAQINVMDYEDSMDMLDESEIVERHDVGNTLIYKLKHPKHGPMLLVVSAQGEAARIAN